jgi:hypothetical protein
MNINKKVVDNKLLQKMPGPDVLHKTLMTGVK